MNSEGWVKRLRIKFSDIGEPIMVGSDAEENFLNQAA